MADASECLAHGQGCLRTADFIAAEYSLRTAIEKDPRLALAYELLGKLLYRDCRSDEAAAIYRAWLQAIPTDPAAAHLVAATGGAPVPERAALAALGYRAPQLVFERAARALDPGAVALHVLDLGCGTGLCGEWFRPLARRLVGVDLSAGMLDEARKRKCYDELTCAEITAYIPRCGERFDVITAADVFCYFGALENVFAAIAKLLQPQGWFVFSVEQSQGDASPVLCEHGRYAHSRSYVERSLRETGLAPVDVHQDCLRFERGAPVEGFVIAARCARRMR
jgi:predicted TPR repeat methyltransferase